MNRTQPVTVGLFRRRASDRVCRPFELGLDSRGQCRGGVVVLVAVFTTAAASARAPALQPPAPVADATVAPPAADAAIPAAAAEEEERGLGQLHRDFGFPGAVRAWEAPRLLVPERNRHRGPRRLHHGGYSYVYDESFFGPYEQAHYGGYMYRKWDSSGSGHYELPLHRATELGVGPPEIQDVLRRQAAYALKDYRKALSAGHEDMARGDYASAVRWYLLAARLNEGDPGSRLCVAHAQVALGRYNEAAAMLRSALELQPKLVHIPVDVAAAFPNRSVFDAQLARVVDEAVRRQTDESLWLLAGYLRINTGDAAGAVQALTWATELNPRDGLVEQFARAVGAAP